MRAAVGGVDLQEKKTLLKVSRELRLGSPWFLLVATRMKNQVLGGKPSSRPWHTTACANVGCTSILASGGRQFFSTWWIGHSTNRAQRVSGEGDRCHDSGGGSRRCAWTTKTQTELANRGTSVGLMDGIWSTHLSNGVNFIWNVGRTIGLPTGGGFAAPLGRLR